MVKIGRQIIADIIGMTDKSTGILSILKSDNDHHYSLSHVLFKLNETWIVLQKEDEHRALSNGDTKYDALTHIWALKTTQNEFKWQHYVYKQTDVSHFRIALYGR